LRKTNEKISWRFEESNGPNPFILITLNHAGRQASRQAKNSVLVEILHYVTLL